VPVSKLLSVAQVSARLQCARSTVRKLVADGELRASRISSRTIRVSETDLLAYIDGRANIAVAAVPSATGGNPITDDQLASSLAERLMGWSVGPERFLLGNRRWMPRWRFQPAQRVEDAYRLLERAGPQEYTMDRAPDGRFLVKVRIAGRTGEACESPQARAITFAIARAIGIEVGQ